MQITIPALLLENSYIRNLPNAVSGTCAPAAGSTAVTGSFNKWAGLSGFKINIDGDDYNVVAATPTVLTLDVPYGGTAGPAIPFTIYPFILLRIYALQTFTAKSDLQIIQGGSPGNGSFYKQVCCTVQSNTAYLPELQLESTTDAVNPGEQNARYYAGFYRPDGGPVQPYYNFEQFMLASTPNSQTWAAISAYNSPGVPPPPNYDTYSKNQINEIFQVAIAAPGAPTGASGDIQLNNNGVLGPSSMRQYDVDTVAVRTTLTQNLPGAASGGTMRFMDVDDGAGNAQWFEIYPTYGAMNLQWQHSGTGMDSREFFIDNGRSRIVMFGNWRGDHDEGDGIGLITHDANQFMNGIFIAGEHHSPDNPAAIAGVYIKAHCAPSSGVYGSGGYNYYFDQFGLSLAADPTQPMHAVTKQYADAHGGGSASPAGTGTETQYRLSGTALGALPGSGLGVDSNGQQMNFLGQGLRIRSYPTDSTWPTRFELQCGAGNQTTFSIAAYNDAILPVSVFYAIHSPGTARFVYFGRNAGGQTVPQYLMFYTGTTGTEDVRRLFISPNGSVHVNEQALADSSYALTTSSGLGGGFANAFKCNGIGEMSADPTTAMGIATKQFVEAHSLSAITQVSIDTVAVKSTLTTNSAGAATGAQLRIMDTDDGAGNAQWLGIYPTLGSMNFFWQHSGTGQTSREFLWNNGRCHMIMKGRYRGGYDEGDAISMWTLDATTLDSQNPADWRMLNGLQIVGESYASYPGPGVYIAVSSATNQYHFDHDGLNLPNDPVLALHAATKQYVDSHGGSVSLSADYAWTGGHSFTKGIVITGPNPALAGISELRITTGGSSGASALTVGSTTGVKPVSIFYALNNTGVESIIYFGRIGDAANHNPAKQMSFWTSPTGLGTSADAQRRLHIGPDGSMFINPGSTAANGAALTIYATGASTFGTALFVNGPSSFAVLPQVYDGTAYFPVKIGAAGSGPGGAGRMLYLD